MSEKNGEDKKAETNEQLEKKEKLGQKKGNQKSLKAHKNKFLLHTLCYSKKIKEIKELLQQNNAAAISMLTEKAGVLGYTPLHEAASSGSAEVLELLLTYGGDANATSGGSYTPLHIAATIGNTDCIKVLLKHGADITQEDEFKKTPYVKAKLSGRERAARQLLSAEVIAAATADDPGLGKKIAYLKPGKEVEEDCFERALDKAVSANHHKACGFLCLQGVKNDIICLHKALKRPACFKAAVMLLLCIASRCGDIEMINCVVKGFGERKQFVQSKFDSSGEPEAFHLLNPLAGADDLQLVRNYLPLEWEKKIPFHVMESLRNESTFVEMAFPICVAVNAKRLGAATRLLLETCTTKGYKYVDWHGLALPFLQSGWILEIVQCEKLNVSHNAIQKLPKNIIKLKNLTRLDLSDNFLCNIPKEIFEIQTLKNLSLANNKIKHLEDVSDWSQAMSILNLKGNYLNALPGGIEDSVLVDFDIAGNCFDQFPLSICEITTLKGLDISRNRYITVLPPQLGKLRQLQSLVMADMDQLTDPPPAMRKTTLTLMKHLEATLRGSKAYFNMKLMFVGQANKGKTTLLHRLQGDFSFNSNQSTVGVEIRDITIRKTTTFTFRCWDFGGQEEYYATHQCFLSQRSLYILVWDLRDGKEGIEQLNPWLNNLGTRVPGSTVLFVGTHLDEISQEERMNGYERKMATLLWELARSRGLYRKIDVPNTGYISVGKDMHDTIEHLRNVIYNTAEKMTVDGNPKGVKIMGDRVPTSYLNLSKAIGEKLKELYKEKKIPILKKEEYAQLVFESSLKTCKDVFPDDMELATAFLHNIGVILHYDDPNQNLRDLYFIDPSWLCKLMGQLVTVKQVHSFFVQGILKISDLSHILRASNTLFPKHFYQQYLRLLYRFQIACKVDEDRILAPSMLPKEQPYYLDEALLEQPMLERVYSLVCIPPGFWPRFIGRLLLYMPDVLGNPKSEEGTQFASDEKPKINNVVKSNLNCDQEPSSSTDAAILAPTSPGQDERITLPKSPGSNADGMERQVSIVLNSCALSPLTDEDTQATECHLPLEDSVNKSQKILDWSESDDGASYHCNSSFEVRSDSCSTFDEPFYDHYRTSASDKTGSGISNGFNEEPLATKKMYTCDTISYEPKQSSTGAITENPIEVTEANQDSWIQEGTLATMNTLNNSISISSPAEEGFERKNGFEIFVNNDEEMTSVSYRSTDLYNVFYRYEKEDSDSIANSLPVTNDEQEDHAPSENSFLHQDSPPTTIEPEVETPVAVTLPRRPLEVFDGASYNTSILENDEQSAEKNDMLKSVFQGETNISSLLEKGILKCWRTGILFKHPDLVFTVSQGENTEDRAIINMKYSRTPLGFSVLARIVDHFRTLINEWYPGYQGDDGRMPFIITLIPCPLCIDFNFKDIHYFDIRECFDAVLSNDFVLCPNSHIPRFVKLKDICPEITFRDMENSLTLSSRDLYFSRSEDNIIGYGKFGTVYRGICKSEAAAVKVYNFQIDKENISSTLDTFYGVRQEVIVLTKLKKHPFIIRFLGVCVRPNICAVMELAEKGTLKGPIHKRPVLIPRSVVYRISYQLISALAYLHSVGMIHRDLKSDNILLFSLDPEAAVNVKLADFGTADFVSSTGLKVTIGTTGYHAPEMLEYSQTDEYTSKVDVYSFAMVLYELITKRRPFHDVDHELSLNAMVREGKRPRFNDVSIAVFGFLTITELMVKAWDSSPMRRPSSAEIKQQFENPSFTYLLGKFQLPEFYSPAGFCTLVSLNETWIACNSYEGPFILVIDMDTGKLKSKFHPSFGKTNTKCLNIINIYYLCSGYVGVVLSSGRDFLFILNCDKKKAEEVHAFDSSFIRAVTLSEENAFIGFHCGKLIKINKRDFLKGKGTALTILPAGLGYSINALSVVGEHLFVGKGNNVAIFSKSPAQSDGLFCTVYQEDRDGVTHITASDSFSLIFVGYKRSAHVTCIRSDDGHIVGELNCGNVVKEELPHSNENDQRVTCICAAQDTLWVGMGSGHLLIYECLENALPRYIVSLRPYILETRHIALYSKSLAGDTVRQVVITSGKDINPQCFCTQTCNICLLTPSLPVDASDDKRPDQRSGSTQSNRSNLSTKEELQDTSNGAPDLQTDIKRRKLVLFWEALPANLLKRFSGIL